MAKKTAKPANVPVTNLTHDDTRKNIPSAEHESVLPDAQKQPVTLRYPRNPDLDPQLVWRGKDAQDGSDLIVQAPPLYIQEKVHPKALIDDLKRTSKVAAFEAGQSTMDLFSDFNGLPKDVDRTEFYQHDQHWTNRMILGDSLAVMGSLAEREGLRGKVQCIYFDPPYGIKFNSNFQWSTTSRDVKDGNAQHITREPEQVKAFRDTWRDGIHSYLSYIRDRLTVARDLLTDSGSVFVQIGHENVHRIRALMDEVFGDENCITEILVKKKGSQKGGTLDPVNDYILWYGKCAKTSGAVKIRSLYETRVGEEIFDDYPYTDIGDGRRLRVAELADSDGVAYLDNIDAFRKAYPNAVLFSANPLKSGGTRRQQSLDFRFQGRIFPIKGGQCWKHTVVEDDGSTPGMNRLAMSNRLLPQVSDVRFVKTTSIPSIREVSNWWDGFGGASNPIYVVQTNERVVQRCLIMSTDPGDLVLDITCGSGTTAYVAEQWGRRWITVDTSRVALALARARLMGARYPYFLLADSAEGQQKEAALSGRAYAAKPTYGKVRQGFVYERARNITSGSIANNAEIDVIHENWQAKIAAPLAQLNADLRNHRSPYKVTAGGRAGKEVKFDAADSATFTMPSGEIVKAYELTEWEVPREAPKEWPAATHAPLADFWAARIARQKEIDASIAAKAESEYLFDRPYEDKKTVRVAGPFTVESLSPHRMLGVDENDGLIDPLKNQQEQAAKYGDGTAVQTFDQMIMENLRTAGVQGEKKEYHIKFTSLTGWPGHYICAEGRYEKEDKEIRAGIFIGPEFGTVGRADLVEAAREAADAGFDVLIALGFNFDAHAAEFSKLGKVHVLKARMNADLHMAADLKATGKGNLFVIFGEPDIEIIPQEDGQLCVKVKGVDVFDPTTGEVRSDETDGIACWMLDSDYNGESFFVRHAYFLGQNDPYKSLKVSLKAEIDEDAWATLNSDISRPFPKPKSGRIAVKVINHLGDEVMKVFRV